MLLHCLAKPFALYILAGSILMVGVATWRFGFLVPAKFFTKSIASSDDNGLFWYKVSLMKYRGEKTLKDGVHLRSLYSNDADAFGQKTDKDLADRVKSFCNENQNTINLIFNDKQVHLIRKLCTLKGDFNIPKYLLRVFLWEYENNCRVVWVKDKDGGSEGWYLPFVLDKSGYYFGGDDIQQILRKFVLFFEANREEHSKSNCPKGGSSNNKRIIPYWWNSKTRMFEYVEDSKKDGFKRANFSTTLL